MLDRGYYSGVSEGWGGTFSASLKKILTAAFLPALEADLAGAFLDLVGVLAYEGAWVGSVH